MKSAIRTMAAATLVASGALALHSRWRSSLRAWGAQRVHAARNAGTTKAAELATYLVEKGKPLVVSQ
jgi:hypothetical protein